VNGPPVNQAWYAHVTEQRSTAAQLRASRQHEHEITEWLKRAIPECIDARTGMPHPRFYGAVTVLSYTRGKGNVRKADVVARVRYAYPDAYTDVYGPDPAGEAA
jgi:hypothetical protein